MANLENLINQEVKNDFEYIKDLRRYFHKFPELAKEEKNTCKKIEEELTKIGIDFKRVGPFGVLASIKGTKEESNDKILLRADIDALPIQEEHEVEYKSQYPNKMHACGHDAHTASLIGAARFLANHKDLFKGEVLLCFQQGEEIGYGAKVMLENNVLDGVSRVYGSHAASNIDSGKVAIVAGPNNASVDWFRIIVHGVPAHVSTPERGVDALYIASQIVVSLQALITRQTNPMDNVLVGVGKLEAGDAYNIVAKEAKLEGTIRVFSPAIRNQIKSKIEELSINIAKIYGGTVTFEWNDNTSALINDEASSIECQKVAIKLFGKDNVITNRPASLGGDDFAEFINKVPGVYAYFGTRNSEIYETTVAHHDDHFDIDEPSLKISTALYIAYAIEYLNREID